MSANVRIILAHIITRHMMNQICELIDSTILHYLEISYPFRILCKKLNTICAELSNYVLPGSARKY